MAASGRTVEITFTPPVDGVVKVTASFNAEGSGSDWGAGHYAKCFCEQSGSTGYDLSTSLGNTRQAYTLLGTFAVTGGSAVKAGLYAGVSGAATLTIYDANVVAEFNAN